MPINHPTSTSCNNPRSKKQNDFLRATAQTLIVLLNINPSSNAVYSFATLGAINPPSNQPSQPIYQPTNQIPQYPATPCRCRRARGAPRLLPAPGFDSRRPRPSETGGRTGRGPRQARDLLPPSRFLLPPPLGCRLTLAGKLRRCR